MLFLNMFLSLFTSYAVYILEYSNQELNHCKVIIITSINVPQFQNRLFLI